MSTTGSQTSRDDSTIDGKMFDWDESNRRALNHARFKTEMLPRPTEKDEGIDTSSHTGTEESLDRPSTTEDDNMPKQKKLVPYDPSIFSEPLDTYGQRVRPILPPSSVSEPGQQRGKDKRFFPFLSRKRSKRNLEPSERNGAPQFSGSTRSVHRGRPGFENSFHTSIEFRSEDGLSAPAIVRAAQAGSVIEVEALLDQGADINARHVQSGRNALSVASHCGNNEVCIPILPTTVLPTFLGETCSAGK